MSHMTIVRGDDWEGIYIDGHLETEGHSIEVIEAVKLAISKRVDGVHSKWCDIDWLHDQGNLPRALSDVKFSDT